jgi:hypothetical protein
MALLKGDTHFSARDQACTRLSTHYPDLRADGDGIHRWYGSVTQGDVGANALPCTKAGWSP